MSESTLPWTQQRIDAVRGAMSDDESRGIFDLRLEFIRTGQIGPIEQITRDYIPELGPLYGPDDAERLARDIEARTQGSKQVYIYGAGTVGQLVLNMLEGRVDVAGLCDVKPELQDRGVRGLPVLSPADLLSRPDEAVLVLGLWDAHYPEMRARFADAGFDAADVIETMDYLNPQWCSTPYVDHDFVPFAPGSFFADAGCYDLTDSLNFIERCPDYGGVVAFEPDRECFEKCESRRDELGLRDVTLIEAGLWSTPGQRSFTAYHNGCSAIGEHGTTTIEVVTIDDVFNDRRLDFLKMDIEGAEIPALQGAAKTIARDRPFIAASMYHRPGDLIEIAELLLSMHEDYRFYLRAYSNTPVDTVLFAL